MHKRYSIAEAREKGDQRSAQRRSFWEAYEEFRRKHADSDIETADVFEGIRDPSPGRDFSW
jgi:hypothetical protein